MLRALIDMAISRIILRRDTAANWSSANPVLSAGEKGYETDTGKLKIGDGTTAWNSLEYRIDKHLNTSSASAGQLLCFLNGEYVWVEQEPPAPAFFGSRGLFAGGDAPSLFPSAQDVIEYVAIATPGNATDFGDLTVGREFSAGCSDGTYGLFGGGNYIEVRNTIDYITISTISNATDFGDLTSVRYSLGSCSDGTYGVFGGGRNADLNNSPAVIDYVTIATPGNATSFGNLTTAQGTNLGSCSDGTYGLFGGGVRSTSSSTSTNVIDYITIATPGNALDFGDLTLARRDLAACSDRTYGVFGSGNPATNTIDYVTIATPGNAVDFGDMFLSDAWEIASCSDGTYGLFAGGLTPSSTNTIQYITIATPGNALDFGDLTVAKNAIASCSGD